MAKNLQETQLILGLNDWILELMTGTMTRTETNIIPSHGATFPLSPGQVWNYIAPHWKIMP